MAYKYFGRLAGSTAAADVVAGTAQPNTTNPFSPVLPATKFIAYGENATSATFNRALTALSVNTDVLAGTLDSPALRYEVLEPSINASAGYTALGSVAEGGAKVDLGQGAKRPVTWLYVGLHKDRLGQYLQLERVSDRADGQQLLAPADVYVNTLQALVPTSYFPAPDYTGTSDNALARKIPGVMPVMCSLPPYAGLAGTTALYKWDTDGCYLSGKTWQDLYARPGCLLSVTSAVNGAPNIGLYRITNMVGGSADATTKAVLTRAYTEVAVTDGTKFNVGDLVGWRPAPVGQQDNTVDYVHRAYVVFKIDNLLYLSDFGGSEDLKVQGTNVADKVDSAIKGTTSLSRYGLIDLEAGADQNSGILIGTILLNLATVGAGQPANFSSDVTNVIPANHPVRFDVSAVNYSGAVCSPPGYLLNPVIEFPSNSMGGAFRLHAHTLTTASENIRSGASSATRGSFVPSTRLGFSDGYRASMERLFTWMHRGDDAGTGSGAQTGPLSPTRQILGEGLWYLTFTANLPTDIPAGAVLQVRPQPATAPYSVTVVRISGSAMWVKHVNLPEKQYGNNWTEILPGGSFTYGNPPVNYVVASVSAPKLESAAGLYVPGEGLNAQYHNHYSANPAIRGNQGFGNRIIAATARPLTVELKSDVDQTAFQVESNQQAYTVIRSGPVGMANTDMALEVVDGTTLQIKDSNATAGVKFSGAGSTFDGASGSALMGGDYQDNIIGAINQALGGLKTQQSLFTNALLSGAEVTAGVGLTINISSASVVGPYGLNVTVPVQQGYPLAANSTFLLRWAGAGASYEVFGQVAATDIVIAKITTGPAAVTGIVDLRWLVNNLDQKLDIHVGGYGAHFETIGEAIKFVGNIANVGPAYQDRRWRILVRGSVVETETIQINSSLKGLVVEGFGEGAVVSWGKNPTTNDFFDTLFELNGADDLVFRNLHLEYDAPLAVAATNTTQRRVFHNLSWSSSDTVLIEGVTTTAVQANRLSCYGVFTSVDRLRIRNCQFYGATDVGFLFTTCSRLRIENSEVVGSLSPQAAAGPYYGITFDGSGSADDAVITDTYINTWRSFGIKLLEGENVKIRNCHVNLITGSGTEWALGIDIQAGNAPRYISVADCLVENILALGTGAARGVVQGATRGHLSNNSARFVSVTDPTKSVTGFDITGTRVCATGNHYVAVGAAIEKGIHVQGTKNIVDANQTGGKGITVLGANNSIGAMNRDDA